MTSLSITARVDGLYSRASKMTAVFTGREHGYCVPSTRVHVPGWQWPEDTGGVLGTVSTGRVHG